ncbi:MAG: proline--tRNA ligase [Chloroflexia bacterium]
MRLSRFFPGTLRQAPATAEAPSYALMLRAALIRPFGSGAFLWLPYGQRVRQRFLAQLERRLAECGAQEVSFGLLFGELPEASSLFASLPGTWMRDRTGRPVFRPDSGIPLLLHFLRHELRSHRLLPLTLYSVRTRSPLAPAGGSGVLAEGDGLVVEIGSLHPDEASRGEGAATLERVVQETLAEWGLRSITAETIVEPGSVPGSAYLAADVPGGFEFLHCESCGYAADAGVATRAKDAPPSEPMLPLEEVVTPGCHTITALAEYLGIPKERTAKAVFRMAGERFVFAIVRGDMEVNEAKLARIVGARDLRPAQEPEIAALGASPGYASPIGIRRSAPEFGIRQVVIVADELIPRSPNLVAGANREDRHLRNVNYGRDYVADIVGDIVSAQDGDPCPRCGSPLRQRPAAVLARTWLPESAQGDELTFQDATGLERPIWLACAEVELDRSIAACVEQHHDAAGISWPAAVAPYLVHLVCLGEGEEIASTGETLYRELQEAGLSVLFDDRPESAGVKLADADLLGAPLRVTVSRRALAAGGVEVKGRDEPRDAARVVPLSEVRARVLACLQHRSAREGC